MGSIVEDQINRSSETEVYSKAIKWSSETNWVITHGSLENSINIESSDCPINELGPDIPTQNPPLVLNPRGPDSGPCEIKICFDQKYEVSQIYVRSSARVYEVYYARSPQSSNEYLCTVRCGIAERDDEILQAACTEDVSHESGGRSTGEVDENAIDGEIVVTSDDDWVNIKGAEAGTSSFSDCTSINRSNMQDLYEATAQISDAEPCSFLTIRLLSLQDKSHVYVDEVYVFADLVESTDTENLVPALSSAQSPILAMLMPTLMQLPLTGVSREKDKLSPDEQHKDDKKESGLERVGDINVGLEKNQVDTKYFKLKEHDKDTTKEDEIQHPPLALTSNKCDESTHINDPPLGRLERYLEQLMSRMSTVEHICLRFEEKLLKPIESIEARLQQVEHQLETRLQQVEHQLEKLSKNTHDFVLPHCTRISAPAFSCSESNSSSFYNEGHDSTIWGTSEIGKKDLSCDDMTDPSQHADIRPRLVVTAPEFSRGEGEVEDNNDDSKAAKDTPGATPKKTLSVDDALAAALSGLLSTAKTHRPENIQPTSGLSGGSDEKHEHLEFVESRETKAQELPAAEDSSIESSSYTPILAIKAPDFTADEIGNEKVLNHDQSFLDTAPVSKNEDDPEEERVVLPMIHSESLITSLDSSDLNTMECMVELEAESNAHSNEITTDILEAFRTSSLDFEFPILEVKFTPDMYTTVNTPLETLLDGEVESIIQTPIYDGSDDDDDWNNERINVLIGDRNGTTDVYSSNHLLVDIEYTAVDGWSNSNLEGGLHVPSTPSSPEMIPSLI